MTRKKKGTIALCVLLCLLLIAGIGYYAVSKKIKSLIPVTETQEVKRTYADIISDHENGLITDDEYVRELYQMAFNNDGTYESNGGLHVPVDFFSLLDEYQDTISENTMNTVLGQLLLCGNLMPDKADTASTGMSKVKAAEDDFTKDDIDITKLDNMLLSQSGKFVVYYTTEGRNACSHEMAQSIVNNLESDSIGVSQLWGISEDYTLTSHTGWKIKDPYNDCTMGTQKWLKKMLKAHGLTEDDIMGAIPIYLMQTMPSEDTTVAYYCYNDSILMDAIVGLLDAKPDFVQNYAFPYIVVQPKALDDYTYARPAIIHELTHHYYRLSGYAKGTDINYKAIEEGFCSYTAALLLPNIGLSEQEGIFEGHAMCALAEADEDLFHYKQFPKGSLTRDPYDYQHFIDVFYRLYGKETIKQVLTTDYESYDALVNYASKQDSVAFMKEYTYRLLSGNTELSTMSYRWDKKPAAVNQIPMSVNTGETRDVECTSFQFFKFDDIVWEEEKTTFYYSADEGTDLYYMMFDDKSKTIVSEGKLTELELKYGDWKPTYLLAIYKGLPDGGIHENVVSDQYSYSWGPAEITSDVTEDDNQIKSIFKDTVSMEFYPTNVSDMFGELLPMLAGNEAAGEFMKMENEMTKQLNASGVTLGKVRVSYIAGYSYDFLKKNHTDSMENALATFDLPTVKASGHVFESKCCFTGKEENTLIINIIDKNGSETILYKIVADATYVK